MNDMNDEQMHLIEDAAKRYTDAFNSLSINHSSSVGHFKIIEKSINNNENAHLALVKIASVFSDIEDCYKEFGVIDNQKNELDLYQSNEISKKAVAIIDDLIKYIQNDNVLNNNSVIDILNKEKELYGQMSQITDSLISSFENSLNTDENQPIENENNKETINEGIDPNSNKVNEESRIYDLDSNTWKDENEKIKVFDLDSNTWQEENEIAQDELSSKHKDNIADRNIDDLLNQIDSETINISDTQTLHVNVANDIIDSINKEATSIPAEIEKPGIYDLDVGTWEDDLEEIKQLLSSFDESSIIKNDIDELLEKLQTDIKSTNNPETIHAQVSNDIITEKASIRQSLEHEYKAILNILIQVKNNEYDDGLFSKVTEHQKNIAQTFSSLDDLGIDSQELVNIDKDKYNLASQFCKVIQDSIIVNQYNQFKENAEKVIQSGAVTNNERLTLSTAHGNLTNNIQESIVNHGSNDELNELWTLADKMMNNVNITNDHINKLQRHKDRQNAFKPLEKEQLEVLIAKADKAIDNKDSVEILDVKAVLQKQQKYLSQSLESAIKSAQNVITLKAEMKAVQECLNKVNMELGIAPKAQTSSSNADTFKENLNHSIVPRTRM